MTTRDQEELAREYDVDGLLFLVAILFVAGLGAAFVYKVWNERQMTHEYHEQAVQAKRSADADERTADALERIDNGIANIQNNGVRPR